MARLTELLLEARTAAARFEPDRWSADDCKQLTEEFTRVAKVCEAAAARAAVRAIEGKAGDLEWAARSSGSTPGAARAALATVRAASACPATNEALTEGLVSMTQAAEIVRAEAAVPGSAAGLLEVAATRGMNGLRAESRRVVLGSIDRDELHRRQVEARSLRHWVDGEGMVAGQFRLPPDVGVPMVKRIDDEAKRLRRSARRAGCAEAHEAHAVDALVALTRNEGKAGSRRPDVVFVCDLHAAARGHTHGEELCHVIGGGPVPVDVVRAAAVDAVVKVVVRDGRKIDTVVHYGRHIPAVLRTALELGDPGRLEGAVCTEEGCDRHHGLEWDHDDPYANGGVTSYENLQAKCGSDHWAKTGRDRRAGKLGGRRGKRAPPGST